MALVDGPNGQDAHHGDFRLSITKALGDQLTVALDALGQAPLTEANLAVLEQRPGVYQLYFKGELVYVGKADKTLPGRLRNHLRKLSGRHHIDLADVDFSCLYVDEDFSALAPEQLLISRHSKAGGIPWNSNGFGNNDPGRRRDSTILKRNHFDVLYPIDLDRPLTGLKPGEYTLHALLKAVKAELPYKFRYAEPPHSEITRASVPAVRLSADQAFRLASQTLPTPWQVTALMGYVIMYPDSPTEYKGACRYYRSGIVVEAVPVASSEEMTAENKIEPEE